MVLRETALAVKRGQDRKFEQFRQLNQFFCGLRIQSALTGNYDRAVCRQYPVDQFRDILRIGYRGGAALWFIVFEKHRVDIGGENIDGHFQHNRAGSTITYKRERVLHHPRNAFGLVNHFAPLGKTTGISGRIVVRLYTLILQHVSTRHIMSHYLKLRLNKARQLVLHSRLDIRPVALSSGFSSLSVFSRAYKTQFGNTPSGHRILFRA